MKPPLSHAPAAGPAIAMAGGIILCTELYSLSSSTKLIIILAGAWILALITLFAARWFYLALCLLMSGAGFALCIISTPPQISSASESLVIRNAIVESVTGPAQQPLLRLRVFNSQELGDTSFRALLTVSRAEHPWVAGDTLRGVVQMSFPAVSELDNDDNYYRARGLSARGYAYGAQLECVTGNTGAIRYLPDRARSALTEIIYDSPLCPGTSALLSATLLGDRTDTPDQLIQDFRSLGLAHILSISGFHVGIIAGFLSFLFFPLRALRRRGPLWQAVLALAGVWFYVFVTGNQPAAVRAGIMFSLLILGRMSGRGVAPVNSLCWAAIIILLINPFWLFEAGFLLSFSAVAGILLLAPKLTPEHLRGFPRTAWQAVIVPTAAVLGTLPASLWTFHAFPLLFLPANIVISILFPLLLICAAPALILPAMGLKLSLMAWPADELYKLIELSVRSAASVPGTYISAISISHDQIWCITLCLGCLVIALYTPGHRSRRIPPLSACIAFLIAAICLKPQPAPPEAYLAMTRNKMAMCIVSSGHNTQFFLDRTTSSDRDSIALASIFRRFTPGTVPDIETKGGNILNISGKSISFNRSTHRAPTDVLIIHKAYTPDSAEIRALSPDKIIICPDISRSQKSKILSALSTLGIPVYMPQNSSPLALTPLLSEP